MEEDWKDWVLRLLQPLDSKLSIVAGVQGQHKMALKILGIGLVIFFTALTGFGFGLIATVIKVWG